MKDLVAWVGVALVLIPSLGLGLIVAGSLKSEYSLLDSSISRLERNETKLLLLEEVNKLEQLISNSGINKSIKDDLFLAIENIKIQTDQLPNENISKEIEYQEVLSIRKDQINLLNSLLLTILQALGASFFIFTAYLSWRNFQSADQKQISERLSQAFMNLADDNPQKCLGGVYSLERVAQDSTKDRKIIVQSLATLIREKSSIENPSDFLHVSAKAMNVILDFKDFALRSNIIRPINFKNISEPIDLKGARLNGLSLKGRNMSGIQLENVILEGCDLRESVFEESIMKGANLSNADLTEAKFIHVNLEGADLSEANMLQTRLQESILERVILNGAELRGASFLNCIELYPDQLSNTRNPRSATFSKDFRDRYSDFFEDGN